MNLLVELSIIVSLIAYTSGSYALCFIASAFWGLSVCGMTSVNASLISKDYEGRLEGFAVYFLMMNLGVCLGFIS